MSWLITLFKRLCFAALFASFGAAASYAATPILPVCSWPFEVTGHGITNVATPDTNVTYWVMPVDLSHWKTMVIDGQYPDARFFSFTSYAANGSLLDSIFDEDIVPDSGSTNPFAPPGAETAGNYTVAIGANPGLGNVLGTSNSSFVFIVYRVYLPDQSKDRTGGVGVPTVTLTDFSGNSRKLKPCPFADAETSLGNLILLLEAAGETNAVKYLDQILMLAQQPPLGTCNPNQPSPATVSFSTTVPGANFFTNPQTTYFQTPNLCYQPGQILVIRGQAPVFPNTYLGGSVFDPAFDDAIQVRYWSMCNNVGVAPSPVVACAADALTALTGHGTTAGEQSRFYTYVVSNDPAPPSWLPPGVTWLPWGPTNFPITLIFRELLPENGFMPRSDDYVPMGVFCNQQEFTENGCLTPSSSANSAP
jgi:hypothetical protein